jgi:hypothetical protein
VDQVVLRDLVDQMIQRNLRRNHLLQVSLVDPMVRVVRAALVDQVE